MADRIKGITVEIGGDTIGLEKALSSVNKSSRNLQSELKDVQRLLKFDPNNAELLAQKQQLLNKQVENTTEKLNTLREAQKQVQAQFERGDIGAEEYRAFQRELAATENQLRATQATLSNMAEEQENVKKSTQELNRFFQVTGKTLEDYSDILGSRLVRAIQNGTATSRDLQTAFQKIATEAMGSSEKVDQLRQSLEKLESGEASIKQVRKELQKIESDANEAKQSIGDLGGELGNLAAGAAAGVGAGAVVQKALDEDTLDTKIDISFDVPEESKQAVRDAVKGVEAYGVDGVAALEAVRRQWAINGDASDASNAKVIKGASMIATTYAGIDLTQLIQESSEMGEALGISQDQALGMTNALLKMGFPPEQLDIISEYGSQLTRAGYDAEQIQGIFAAGIETKSWNIDVLLDGVKEGRIRLAEFGAGVNDATAKLIEGTGISTTQLQEWGKAIAAGGAEGQTAMNEVSLALAGIEDATLRNQIGTALFGTLWEEQGAKITAAIDGANTSTGNLTTNQKAYNDAVAATDTSAQVELNNALNAMNEALQPLYIAIANFVTKMAEWVAANPQVAAGIAIVTGAIAAIMALIPTFIIIFRVLMTVFRVVATVARVVALAIAGISAPVWIAIAAIAAIIAIGVLLYKNWEKISDGAMQMSKKVGDKFMEMHTKIGLEMGKIKTAIEVKWNNVKSFLMNIDLVQIGKNAIQGFVNGISSMGGAISTAVSKLAAKVPSGLTKFLKMGSPSKLTMELGEFTGEGLAIGLENSLGMIDNISKKMAVAATPQMPKAAAASVNTAANKNINVNFHSPKALDVREANKQLKRTLNNMALMW